MRLSEEQVRQGIVHPDAIVRDAAVRYFSEAFSADPTVAPLAIRAIETYGWEDAFEVLLALDDLVHTEQTLLWSMEQAENVVSPSGYEQTTRRDRLSGIIARALAELLARHKDTVFSLGGLAPDDEEAIADRIRLLSTDTGTCWRELEEFCEREKGAQSFSEVNIAGTYRLAEAISRNEGSAGRVLSILSQKVDDYENNPMGWMELLAARIARKMRLEAAAPLLVSKLIEDVGDYTNEECLYTFAAVGTDQTVRTICEPFREAPWHYRLYASGALERIHSDLAVTTCLDLLGSEEDADARNNLLGAVLNSFSSEGIEPALEITREGPMELRRQLIAAATLLDVTFPELEQWRGEEHRQRETMKRRSEAFFQEIQDSPPEPDAPSPIFDALGAPRQPVVDGLYEPNPVAPILRDPKTGRNDPCPCGSGRKYKKCCLRKAKAT